MKKRRKRRKGTCGECNQPAAPGKAHCDTHLLMRRIRALRVRDKRIRERRCDKCGKPLRRRKGQRCRKCQDYQVTELAARRKRWKLAGLCSWCGGPQATKALKDGTLRRLAYCQTCRDKANRTKER